MVSLLYRFVSHYKELFIGVAFVSVEGRVTPQHVSMCT